MTETQRKLEKQLNEKVSLDKVVFSSTDERYKKLYDGILKGPYSSKLPTIDSNGLYNEKTRKYHARLEHERLQIKKLGANRSKRFITIMHSLLTLLVLSPMILIDLLLLNIKFWDLEFLYNIKFLSSFYNNKFFFVLAGLTYLFITIFIGRRLCKKAKYQGFAQIRLGLMYVFSIAAIALGIWVIIG